LRDAPEKALEEARGGRSITDRIFGVIFAPHARARVGHMPGGIMIIDLGGSSRGNQASTSYIQSTSMLWWTFADTSHTVYLVNHRLSKKNLFP
jgi:hypothetical protein